MADLGILAGRTELVPTGHMPTDRPANLTLEHLHRIGRCEAPGGTVFRYDGWRRVWVVSRPEGEVEIPEDQLLELANRELVGRGSS